MRAEALRLADALDGYAHGDEFQRVTEQAAELLRQWPETHATYPVRCPETGLICSTCPTLRIPCEAAAPSQQPAPARPDEFVCPHCFDEGAAPQAVPQPLTREQHIALCEAQQWAREQSYFDARPQIDDNQSRRVFGAAFKAGYEAGYETLTRGITAKGEQ